VAEIAFISSDVERANAFYRDVLGIEIGAETLGVNFGQVGEQYVGYALEDQVRGLRPVTAGKIHLAFEVEWDDLDRAKAELDARGIENKGPVTFPHPFHGPPGSRGLYFEDPDGNQLELWARGPGEAAGTSDTNGDNQ
jgi:catechol 2,3-dioxygenase-like lactoylglutathione lyase family enzyme